MNELVVLEQLTPLELFTPQGTTDILERIKKEARSHLLDISTAEGRKQIASLAYSVAKSKTYLDDMGKELVAEQKKQIGLIDSERKRIRDELDALKEEIRAPLTEWENREQERVKAHEAALLAFDFALRFDQPHPPSTEVQERLDGLQNVFARDWQEFAKRAQLAYDAARARLTDILTASQKHEAEQAELIRLRREEEERKAREREEHIKAEAAAKAKAEAEEKARKEAEAQAARVKAEQEKAELERLRIQKEKEEAEARAKKAEDDRLAAIAKAEQDRKAAEEKAAAEAKAAAEKAEREKTEVEARARKAEEDRLAAIAKAESDRKAAEEKAERDRVESERKAKEAAEEAAKRERERIEEEKRKAQEEAAKREADKKHRAKVNNEALSALVEAGIAEADGKKVIEAVAKGLIPHVKISY